MLPVEEKKYYPNAVHVCAVNSHNTENVYTVVSYDTAIFVEMDEQKHVE